MSNTPIKLYTGSIASGASTLTSIELKRSYRRLFLEVGTMSTATEFTLYASQDGTTFRPVCERVNTAPVQYQQLFVTTGIGSSGGYVPIDPVNAPYLQLRLSAVVSGGVSITVHGVD